MQIFLKVYFAGPSSKYEIKDSYKLGSEEVSIPKAVQKNVISQIGQLVW